MVAIPARDAESLVRTGFSKYPVILFYGPDEGLVSERAEAVAKATTGGDAANIMRMDGDEAAANPERLAEEAHAISMFGGNRAIRIRAGSKSFIDALKPLLSTPPIDARIIVEAGDLKPGAPLRALIDKAQNAAAAPCYPEEGRDLSRLIDEILGQAGLAISNDARAALTGSLGQDRRRSRMEVEKLALYCQGGARVELADVEAVVTDAAAISTDAVIDAAFLGRMEQLETEARRLFADGMDPGVLLGFALRHIFQLQAGRRLVDGGSSAAEAAKTLRIHFRRERAFAEQLQRWQDVRLARAIQIMGEAALSVRRNAALGEAMAIRALWSVALASSRA
ncbi:MAG: DNA polymerase III subunit delta [Beijerinckiaceae bacterium]